MGTQKQLAPSFGDLRRVTYTTVFGRQCDELYDPALTYKTKHPLICFTDQPIKSSTWEIVQMPTVQNPVAANRQMKILWHKVFPDAVDCMYCDANFELRKPIEQLDLPHSFYNHRHHARSRISDEALRIIYWRKADKKQILHQLQTYQSKGFDTEKNPQRILSCNMVLYRQQGCEELCERWWAELEQHTLRDQMSLDFVAWQIGFDIHRFGGTVRCTRLGKMKPPAGP